MSSAIEVFREQRDLVAQVHGRLAEVSQLLERLHGQATTLAADKELRTLLRDEQRWLAEARQLVTEVRYFRESSDYRWRARLGRWMLTCCFALASAMAAGAGYAVFSEGREGDPSLRSRAAFADAILERLDGMTPSEQRQFDRLMKGNATTH
jgi:hypothetical protein